jgi:hypothetical protein
VQVVSAERVQNAYLWDSYACNRWRLLAVKYKAAWACGDVRLNPDSPGGGDVIEGQFWHGTRPLPPHTLASSAEGWCASYARAVRAARARLLLAVRYSALGQSQMPWPDWLRTLFACLNQL